MIKTHDHITDEECLISVYRQSKISGFARVNFISAKLNTDSDTTLGILKKLSDSGLIKIESYGFVSLTDFGLSKVEAIQNKALSGG